MTNLHPALSFLIVLLLGIALGHWVGLPWVERIPFLLRVVAGGIVVKLALGLVILGAVALRRHHTPIEPGHTPTALVMTGPFRFTRNPLYLGQILFLTGLGLAFFPWLILGALVQGLLLDRIVIQAEERRIAARFGQEYDAYRQKVRRWI